MGTRMQNVILVILCLHNNIVQAASAIILNTQKNKTAETIIIKNKLPTAKLIVQLNKELEIMQESNWHVL